MKNFFVIILSLVVVFTTSCSQSSKLEKAAKSQAEITFKEIAKVPESVKLSDFKTVYLTDSICVMRLNFTAKNGLGNESTDKMEYIYMLHGCDILEYHAELDEDSIFLSEAAMDKEKKGKIYESLNYDDALMYRIIKAMNLSGDYVGNREVVVNLPIPTGTGNWDLKSYKNDFGEDSGMKYLVLKGYGKFNNSATTGSEMSSILFVDDTDISLRLIEYSSSVVKDEEFCDLKVKDADGEVHRFYLYNSSNGNMNFYGKDRDVMRAILSKEGRILLYGEMGKYSVSQYQFFFDLEGYNKAYTFVK